MLNVILSLKNRKKACFNIIIRSTTVYSNGDNNKCYNKMLGEVKKKKVILSFNLKHFKIILKSLL